MYLGFGSYRRALENPRLPIKGSFRIAPLNGGPAEDIQTTDSAIDLVSFAGRLYVLTYSALEEWDLETRTRVGRYPTHTLDRVLDLKEHAQALVQFESKLIIAHGRLGVTFFDLEQKKATKQIQLATKQLPYESMATGITRRANQVVVVMDNYHLADPRSGRVLFRGLITLDAKAESVISEQSGLDPGADALVSDERYLVVSYGGIPIWRYLWDSLQLGSKLPAHRHIFVSGVKGRPTGRPYLDEKYYHTCFFRPPRVRGENGGQHVRVPLSVDRLDFGL